MGIGVAGELGIDGQPDGAAVHAGHLDGIFHPLGAARDGCHVGLVLLGSQNLFEDGPQLQLTEDAAGLDAREHLLQPAHIGGKGLHLAQALVHLLQLLVDGLEALRHPLLQRVLQLLVHRVPNFVQLAGVLSLQGGHALGKGPAQLFQLLGIGGFQTLEPLGQDVLLAALALCEGRAHVLHGGLQRLAHGADGRLVAPGQCLLLLSEALCLRVQLLLEPGFQRLVVAFLLGPGAAVEQQGQHQADGHQQDGV